MNIITSNANNALKEIIAFFAHNKIDNIENAIKKNIVVDCSRTIGNRDTFIVTIEFGNHLIKDEDFLFSLNELTRTEMKWHSSENYKEIFVGVIDDPQFSGNRCSFFIIEKFLNEIINSSQLM